MNSLRSFKAILIGSGIGNNEYTVDFVRVFLAGLDEVVSDNFQGVVIDADGLNALAVIEDWRALTSQEIIITPHLGEMATLSGLQVDHIRQNKLMVSADYAQKWQSTVVLKGPGTVISNSNGDARLSDSASSALSHAGTGDVLEPEGDVIGIGSGGNYALADGKVLIDTDMNAEQVAKKAIEVASEICVFTNNNIKVEKI